MRKNTFLIATAVAALTLGTSAFAQQSEKAAPGGGSGAAPSHSAQPQNRMGQSQGGEHNRTGQAEQKKSQTTGQGASGEQNRMGQGERKKSQTTGQAPSEKASPKSSQHEGNKAQKPNERSGANPRSERNNRGTTGQAPAERNNTNAGERNNTNAGERNNTNAGERNNTNAGERSNTSARGGSNTSVSLTTEQRTRIHSIIVSEKSAPRVAHVDFDVRVGTRVPRGKVHLVAIPSSIIEIQPAWRGFEYFLVGNEIVVVDPSTLEIVAVLPA